MPRGKGQRDQSGRFIKSEDSKYKEPELIEKEYPSKRDRQLDRMSSWYKANKEEVLKEQREKYQEDSTEILRRNREYKEKTDYDRVNKEKRRDTHLRRTYGMSAKDYDDLFELQEGKCFICERHQSEFESRLCVDHDHVTGEVRGLLCNNCNHRVLGRHRDPKVFRRIVIYLEKEHTGWFAPKKKKRRSKKKLLKNIEKE